MVKIMEHPIKHGMIWGHHYFWKHPYDSERILVSQFPEKKNRETPPRYGKTPWTAMGYIRVRGRSGRFWVIISLRWWGFQPYTSHRNLERERTPPWQFIVFYPPEGSEIRKKWTECQPKKGRQVPFSDAEKHQERTIITISCKTRNLYK